jgi:diadenosine tetraphosphatase ApaH/serine/threonine PP2A family protein phosphatase
LIGDVHGNLDDLITIERSLWKRYPLSGPNMVFLGDMVDRGKWSVECATYLLCLATIAPTKITLLRGNHEVRSLQCHYSYRVECIQKYGSDLGPKLWELTNRLFDLLPLCAVVDGAVFCAHGGIPRATTSLEEIAVIPEDIDDPEHQSQIAWEMLWSDPMAQPLFMETARLMKVDLTTCEGFLHNRKRGTAWTFNEEALNRFLGKCC